MVEVVNTKFDAGGAVIGVYETTAANAAYGGRVVVLPYVARRFNGRNTTWMVRNISGGAITVTPHYYREDGSEQINPGPSPFVLGSAATTGFAQINDAFLSDNWRGSVVLESTGAIVAVVIEDGANMIAGYNGVVLSQ